MCRRPAQKGAVLRKRPLQSAGADRTNDGQDQALQTYRATLREDGNKLCLIPRTRLRIHLDQIRPHGLEVRGPGADLESNYETDAGAYRQFEVPASKRDMLVF